MTAHRQNSGLVHHVFQIRAGGVGHPLGHVIQIHIGGKRLALGVDLQNFHTAFLVGIVYRHLTVKAARTQQRRVEDIPAVGSRHDDDAFVDGETVHLHQQLVQGLLALVVTAA